MKLMSNQNHIEYKISSNTCNYCFHIFAGFGPMEYGSPLPNGYDVYKWVKTDLKNGVRIYIAIMSSYTIFRNSFQI